MDYRGLNNITIKNQYPLPLIGESLDRLGRARRFTQLDLTNAYHRMRIREGDEWKTAFRTRYGHFEYQVMPFGLSNAPATFQRYVNKILAEKLDIFVIVYLDDILIFTKDPSPLYVEAVHWILNKLRKYSLFTNLKKCCFHQDEICFLGYIILFKGISMETEQIKVVKKWPEPKSVQDIQVFLGFAYFYHWFIKGFSKITAPLTSMLKTTMSLQVLAANEMLGARVLATDESSNVGGGDGSNDGLKRVEPKTGKLVKSLKLSKSRNSKGKNSAKSKKPSKSGNLPNFDTTEAGLSFLTSEARAVFNHLWLAFTKAPILQHFDPECPIWIEIDASSYAISDVLSQRVSKTSRDGVVTKADLSQWYPVAFFSRKMISAETQYETHDGKFFAIVEALKTWGHYLESCKHEIFILTDHNNLHCFMDMKSLSFKQVCWAQKLSWYYFQINHRQDKANAAAEALSWFPQRSQDEKDEL